MGINWLDKETHVYTEESARFIYGHGKHNQAWQGSYMVIYGQISTDFMMETVWASSINQPIRKTKVHWNMHITRDYL